MQPFDPLGTTHPVHPAPPPAPSPPRMIISRRMLVPVLAGSAVFALVIGILIGRRCTGDGYAPAAAPTSVKLTQLEVTSKPVDANVLVDGRFVGVTPLARVDLDRGKHSIVVDSFGYQPYAGTLEIETEDRARLRVELAPLGGGGATNGELVGRGGKVSNATVPATALSVTGTGTSKDAPAAGAKPARRASSSSSSSPPPPPAYEPPPRPRRDCSGEKSQCRDGCSRAQSDCRFRCPNCVSCPSSVGSDECKRQCDTCRGGCEQNVKFCESSCESNYSSCSSSQ